MQEDSCGEGWSDLQTTAGDEAVIHILTEELGKMILTLEERKWARGLLKVE